MVLSLEKWKETSALCQFSKKQVYEVERMILNRTEPYFYITQATMVIGYKNWFTFSIWTYAGFSAYVENFIFKGVKAEFPYVEEIDFCLSKDQTLFWHNGTGSVVGKESQ